MKGKVCEVQTEMHRSLVAPEMQTLSASRTIVRTSRAPQTQRRHGGAACATNHSLIASYSLLLLNSISRRPTRSNRCLRGGEAGEGCKSRSLQQEELLSFGAWRKEEEAPEVSRRRLQAAPGWRPPSSTTPRPERRSPRQRAETRRAQKFSWLIALAGDWDVVRGKNIGRSGGSSMKCDFGGMVAFSPVGKSRPGLSIIWKN